MYIFSQSCIHMVVGFQNNFYEKSSSKRVRYYLSPSHILGIWQVDDIFYCRSYSRISEDTLSHVPCGDIILYTVVHLYMYIYICIRSCKDSLYANFVFFVWKRTIQYIRARRRLVGRCLLDLDVAKSSIGSVDIIHTRAL